MAFSFSTPGGARFTDELDGERGPDTSSPFATPSSAPNTTPVHNFPLPPEGREFRPDTSGGRYVLPAPTGGPMSARFTRVTTGAKALDDTTGLDQWKMRNVVLGLKTRPELLDGLDLFADPADVTKQLNRVASKASEAAGAAEAAERGTAIHAWAEAVERDGLDPAEVPSEFRPYVDAYLAELERAGVRSVPELVERIVWHEATGMVGTLDRVYELADGTRVIGDLKTSKTLRYGYLSFAMQLATYADGARMLKVDGSGWEDMPAVGNAYGVIAHVPSNRPGVCELVTLDLEAGRHALELAAHIRKVRADAARHIPNQWELPAPSLETRIRRAATADELAALWTAHAAEWNDRYTELGYARLTELSSGNAPK